MASFSTTLSPPVSVAKLAGIGCSEFYGGSSIVMLGGHSTIAGGNSAHSRRRVVRAVSTQDKPATTQQQAARVKKTVVQRTFISETLSSRWREVCGASDWKDLLEPLDADVRAELIRVGEFVQGTYDGFDGDEHSKYQGSCRFNKDTFLNKVGLVDTGYEVTKYLYSATDVKSPLIQDEIEEAWSRSSNWAGYVAVCTDPKRIQQLGRREILVAWRGTIMPMEWAADLKDNLVPNSLDDRDKSDGFLNPKIAVEQGFLSLYTTKNENTMYNRSSAREQLLRELTRLIKKYDNETLSITVSGHSLGAALAVLSAYDIAESGINRHFLQKATIPTEWNQRTMKPTPTSDPGKTKAVNTIPLAVFSFAGPRVGNTAFVDRVTNLGVKVLRVVNVNDFVPKVPGLIFNNECKIFNDALDKLPWTYSHCGEELQLNNEDSPFLRPRPGLPNCHNFEGYLHLVAGYVGKKKGTGKDFKLQLRRDIALVNKSSDLLKPQKYIPSCWWQMQNKGLVVNEDYEWVQAERNTEDIPTPEDTEINLPK